MGPKSKSATRKVDPKRSKKPTKDGTNADSATKSEKVGKNKSDKNRTSSKSSESRVKSASTKGNVSGKGKKDPSGSTKKKEASFLAKFLSCFKIGGHKSVPAPDNSASDQQLLEHALGETEEEEPHFVIDAEDVKNFVHAWGNDFITNLISAYAFDEVYEKSTIEIQRVVRGYLGRRRAAHMWRVAVADFADFWNFKHENKMGDQEMLRRQQLVIQQVAAGAVKKSVRSAIFDQQKIDAARLIQSHWRGYVVRQVYSHLCAMNRLRSPYKIRKVERKSRMRTDAKRVMWARKYYEPYRGWPGKADFVEYDMWDHTDVPPKGRDYGLKTYKVKAVPTTSHDQEILHSDKNAWVAVPINIVTEKEAKPLATPYVQKLVESSPYRPIRVSREGGNSTHCSSASRVLGPSECSSVGWSPSMIDRTLSNDQVIANSKRELFVGSNLVSQPSMLSYLGDADTIPDFQASSRLSPTSSPNAKGSGLESPSRPKMYPSMTGTRDNESSAALSEVAPTRHVRKTTNVSGALDSLSQTDVVTLWHANATYLDMRNAKKKGQVPKQMEHADTAEVVNKSSWGRIKSAAEWGMKKKAAVISPVKHLEDYQYRRGPFSGPDVLEMVNNDANVVGDKKIRASMVWPTKPRRHFKLRYTWLPQPMVKRAVQTLYYDDKGTEKGEAGHLPFGAGSPPRRKEADALKSHIYDPAFDDVGRKNPQRGDLNSVAHSSRVKSPNRSVKISMLMSNMNSLSAISSTGDFDGNSSVHSRFSRPQISQIQPPKETKVDHPYHWL